MLELGLDQFAAVKALAIDPARPVARRKETHQVELTRLQRLQPRGAVLVDLDRDAFEIAGATADVEVACPVTGVAQVGDVAAKLHRPDTVGPAADREVHHHLVERFGLAVLDAPLSAEDRQAPDRQRKLPVRLLEPVAHAAVVEHIDTRNVLEQALVGRRGVRPHQGVVAVFDVRRQHRVAIVKAG